MARIHDAPRPTLSVPISASPIDDAAPSSPMPGAFVAASNGYRGLVPGMAAALGAPHAGAIDTGAEIPEAAPAGGAHEAPRDANARALDAVLSRVLHGDRLDNVLQEALAS